MRVQQLCIAKWSCDDDGEWMTGESRKINRSFRRDDVGWSGGERENPVPANGS